MTATDALTIPILLAGLWLATLIISALLVLHAFLTAQDEPECEPVIVGSRLDTAPTADSFTELDHAWFEEIGVESS